MQHPDYMLKELPPLPCEEVEVFNLDGDYDFKSPISKEGALRSAGIVSRMALAPSQAQEALAILSDLSAYGGMPARCFIPRHGLRFRDARSETDVLICLECYWIYFFSGSKRVMASLSSGGRESLEKFFGSVPNKS